MVVKSIIVELVAVVTSGRMPSSISNGPFTVPPPTPNQDAMMPAKTAMGGYHVIILLFHFTSPGTN